MKLTNQIATTIENNLSKQISQTIEYIVFIQTHKTAMEDIRFVPLKYLFTKLWNVYSWSPR